MYLNFLLRAIALGVRASFILVLVYYLTPEEVGQYGLIVSILFFGVLLIGGDFYTYSQRKLANASNGKLGFFLKNQIIAHLLLYCMLIPVGIIIFPEHTIPSELAVVFFVLLILEHILLEMSRVLLALQIHLVSSKLMVFRVVWVLILVPLMSFYENFRSIEVVLYFWLTNAIISIFFYILTIKKEAPEFSFWQEESSFSWIFQGVKASLIYFISTLLLRSLTVLDRITLEYGNDLSAVGVYTLYISIAMTISLIVDAVLMSYYYPKLINCAGQNCGKEELVKLIKNMIGKTLFIIVSVVAVVFVSIVQFAEFFPDPIYIENIKAIWWLLLAASVFSLMLTPHFVLYAYHLDKENIFSTVLSLVAFFVVIYFFKSNITILSTAYSLCSSFIVMLIMKSIFAYRKISHIPHHT
jgi:O-antigen/teichoic acid export membrane protein